MGIHWALTRGYQGILTIDGNNKDSIESVPLFLEKLGEGFDLVQGRRFIKGVEKDGRVTIQSSQGNGSLKSTVGCNCFVDIPTGSKNLSAGDKAVVLLV